MSGPSGVGYCRLVIEDSTGKTVRDDEELCIVVRSGRPDVGSQISLDFGRFVVDRVEFEPEPRARGKTVRNYYYPILFLRPVGGVRTSPSGPGRKPSLFPSGHDGSRNVIAVDFVGAANASELTSTILPVNLIANLVTIGYRVQASDFDDDRRLAATLLRSDEGRFLFKDSLATMCDALSREAKANAVHSHAFFAAGTIREAAVHDEESEGRGSRPQLKLVRDTGDGWTVRAA
jgi:hypothetical protein